MNIQHHQLGSSALNPGSEVVYPPCYTQNRLPPLPSMLQQPDFTPPKRFQASAPQHGQQYQYASVHPGGPWILAPKQLNPPAYLNEWVQTAGISSRDPQLSKPQLLSLQRPTSHNSQQNDLANATRHVHVQLEKYFKEIKAELKTISDSLAHSECVKEKIEGLEEQMRLFQSQQEGLKDQIQHSQSQSEGMEEKIDLLMTGRHQNVPIMLGKPEEKIDRIKDPDTLNPEGAAPSAQRRSKRLSALKKGQSSNVRALQ